MASAKVVLYTSKKLKKQGHFPLMLQVIKERKRKYFSIGHNCSSVEWEIMNNDSGKKPNILKRLKIKIQEEEQNANRIILDFEDLGIDYSLEDFSMKYKNANKKVTVFAYFDEWISKFEKSGKIGNASVYKDTKRILKNFSQKEDISFPEVNRNFLNKLEEWYLNKGLKPNGLNVYMRTLRSVFNKAIEDNLIKKELYPFDRYKVSKLNRPTLKRAIKKDDIRRIIDLDLEIETPLYHSKNYFAFSFYCMGMNFMDMALLKWSNIENNRIEYDRAKTGKHYSIALLPPVEEILNYYKVYNAGNKYIFPILNETLHITPQSKYNRIIKCRKMYNSDLKEIASRLNIENKLTSYVPRHSWATAMKKSGISTAIISEGMGHDSEKTTQIYLDSFERETLDEANKNVLL